MLKVKLQQTLTLDSLPFLSPLKGVTTLCLKFLNLILFILNCILYAYLPKKNIDQCQYFPCLCILSILLLLLLYWMFCFEIRSYYWLT